MADGTKIEWSDATWNPITGCSVVSPGCKHCYAMKLAGTRMKHHWSRKGLTDDTKAGPVWNGKLSFNHEWLEQPIGWKRPRGIFVNAHGDTFHENAKTEWIDAIFAVVALAPQHQFQMLTKRSKRMREYFAANSDDRKYRVCQIIDDWYPTRTDATRAARELIASDNPLPNVWLGVSCEDQQRADERIPDLLATPAAVRFISAEPLLGPIDLELIPLAYALDWVIVGGESGQGARPMHPDWARSLRDQCQTAGVAFHFKQWGQWHPDGQLWADGTHGLAAETFDTTDPPIGFGNVGKKTAGRFLDGRTWDEMPA